MTPKEHLQRVRERAVSMNSYLADAKNVRVYLHKEIRDAYRAGLSLRQLSEASGLSYETVRSLVGEQWVRTRSEAQRVRRSQ
jgi:hypothetical protein